MPRISRIADRFAALKAKGRAGLVTFVTAGDPDPETSREIVKVLSRAGADLIELGMPFSDPMADGPAIQAASVRALKAGGSMITTLGILREFRTEDQTTPVILMGYVNPVLSFGVDAFAREAVQAGADGVILVDLPPEEDAEIREAFAEAGLDLIRLIAPTTDAERLPKVIASASGFLYYVSITGVTGTRAASADAIAPHLAAIREKTTLPLAVGFGIRTPEDVANMAKVADAVVVGSVLVDTIARHETDPNLVLKIAAQVEELALALDSSMHNRA